MEPFVERIVKEQEELQCKIGLLEGFVGADKFNTLELSHRLLLRKQLGYMHLYNAILLERYNLCRDEMLEQAVRE